MAHCTLVISAARNLCLRSLVFSFGNFVWDICTLRLLALPAAKPFATIRYSSVRTVKPSHDRLPSLAHPPRSILLLLSPSILLYRSSPPKLWGLRSRLFYFYYSRYCYRYLVTVYPRDPLRGIYVSVVEVGLERRIDGHSSRRSLLFKLLRATNTGDGHGSVSDP